MSYVRIIVPTLCLSLFGCASSISQCEIVNREYELTETIDPVYPPAELEAGIEGWVVVEMTVDESGIPKNLKVFDSYPNSNFNDSAVAAVRQFRFTPRVISCNPEPVDGVRLKVKFNVEPGNI